MAPKDGRNGRSRSGASSIRGIEEPVKAFSAATSSLKRDAADAYCAGVRYCASCSEAALRLAQDLKCDCRRLSSDSACTSGFDRGRNAVSARRNSMTVQDGETFLLPGST